LGVAGREHLELKSTNPLLEKVYRNCTYACKLCNDTRGRKERKSGSGTLLDPTRTAWGEHFDVVGDELVPKPGDRAAKRTAEVYGVNDGDRIHMRRRRRDRFGRFADTLRLLDGLSLDITQNDDFEVKDDDDLESTASERRAKRAQRGTLHALLCTLDNVREYAAVPKDRPDGCACSSHAARSLPEWLNSQCSEIPGWAIDAVARFLIVDPSDSWDTI